MGPEAIPMEIEAEIRDFIARNLLYSEGAFPHGDDASFLDEGTIDSIGVLELVNREIHGFNAFAPRGVATEAKLTIRP